jgi:hypothetical protein
VSWNGDDRAGCALGAAGPIATPKETASMELLAQRTSIYLDSLNKSTSQLEELADRFYGTVAVSAGDAATRGERPAAASAWTQATDQADFLNSACERLARVVERLKPIA